MMYYHTCLSSRISLIYRWRGPHLIWGSFHFTRLAFCHLFLYNIIILYLMYLCLMKRDDYSSDYSSSKLSTRKSTQELFIPLSKCQSHSGHFFVHAISCWNKLPNFFCFLTYNKP